MEYKEISKDQIDQAKQGVRQGLELEHVTATEQLRLAKLRDNKALIDSYQETLSGIEKALKS